MKSNMSNYPTIPLPSYVKWGKEFREELEETISGYRICFTCPKVDQCTSDAFICKAVEKLEEILGKR